jgi:hypothetical protein
MHAMNPKIWMPQHHHLHKLLGVPKKLPKDFHAAINVTVNGCTIAFQVFKASEADAISSNHPRHRHHPGKPGRGRPRIFAQCSCGRWIPAGRFNQHFVACKAQIFDTDIVEQEKKNAS